MHCENKRSCQRFCGFTVVELLVAISILGLLVALILPAVQSSREASRAVDCRNKLHQIGIALNSHEASHKVFPCKNLQSSLEPYIEVSDLPGFLRCASDPESHRSFTSVSYLMNHGTRIRIYPRNGFAIANHTTDSKPSDFTDGLSNTAAFSERLIGEGGVYLEEAELRADPLRYVWYTRQLLPNNSNSEQQLAVDCESPVTPYPWSFDPGLIESLGYDHRLPPNTRACTAGPPPTSPDAFFFFHAYSTATSLHPGGVNVLFGDGAVRQLVNSIDLNVWRAIGTRSGNEPAIGEF